MPLLIFFARIVDMSLGTLRIVVPREATDLIDRLIERGHRVTYLEGKGARGPVSVGFSVVKRKGLHDIIRIVKELIPDAFFSIEDVRLAREYDYHTPHWPRYQHLLRPFYWFRKSK